MAASFTAVIGAVVIAGCSMQASGSAGTASPVSGDLTSSTSAGEGSSPGLSIAEFADNPCDVLTAEQVAKLGGVNAGKPGTSTLGVTCEWAGKVPTDNSTYTVYVTEDRDVEAMVQNVKGQPIFTDKKIGDVRVVVNDSTDGTLHCRAIIEVGKTDSVTVDARIAAAERASKPACTEVESVATMVIETLRG
ncbi:Protein of unknown function [Lentzea fradiae]|uniref:DUF3558 domain-containing protein n=1 Tax=Lentzea fradiae TaxID=200378 RepID=A0A1G7SC96_9PSEU|nr:DUF3558 domain-containing protein [Lentzea fradiae]SDG20601.1 Protein of unknown function [Lentzea fradiae]